MKIEAGKYYRMLCGGAVKIDKYDNNYFRDKSGWWWNKDGVFASGVSTFDLVFEISEDEYNRIIYGGAFDRISARVTDEQRAEVASQLDRLDEIEALKAENAALKDQRRFEAAKAAMQGIIAGNYDTGVHNPDNVTEVVAVYSVKFADALIKALNDTTR